MKTSTSKLDSQAKLILMREWNARVKKQAPGKRMAWLDSAMGLVAHGAKQRKQLVSQLRAMRGKLEDRCCSEAWMDAGWHGGDPYRGRGMCRAIFTVRYGEGVPRQRATPLPAVALEDELDGLSYAQAEFYDRPASPSALAIQRIGLLKGRELSIDELARRAARRTDKRVKFAAKRSLSPKELLESVLDQAVSAI